MPSVVGALLGVLLLAPADFAQLSEKQADAAVLAVTKNLRKGHAESVQERTATVLEELDALADAAPGAEEQAFADAFDALEDWQIGLFEDFRAYHDLAIDEVQGTLGDYALGVPIAGAFPGEFYFGHGGALDHLRADMQAAQAKCLAKVRKKLAKAGAKLEKATGALLSFHIELATTQGNDAFTQTAITSYVRVPLSLHTVLALGFEDAEDDGLIRAAGLGEVAVAVNVRALGESGLEVEAADFFEPGSPYWHVLLDDDGDGLSAGNWLVVAEQGTVGTSFGGYVSVRRAP
jgi:hypothetical protein